MDSTTASILALGTGVVVLVLWVSCTPARAQLGPLPPGPRPLPVVGNMFQMPGKRPWYQFTEWSKKYGPIFTLSLPGKRIIVLNTHALISENLGKLHFSDRPKFTVVGELMGFNQASRCPHSTRSPSHIASLSQFLLLLSEGPELKLHKRLAAMALNTTAVRHFAEVQREAIHRCVVRVLNAQDHAKEFRVAVVRSIVRMTYGFTVDSLDDPDKGNAPPSFMANLLEGIENGSIERCDDDVIGSIGGTLYGGGVDTTNSTLLAFVLLACRHPHIQDIAFEELKRVVGMDRLPVIEDRENMPYVLALIQEVLRFHPIAPLGFFIPKNSTIVPNAWAIARQEDGSGFPPDEFHPERFLSPSAPHAPGSYVFGVGRRACMGQDVAENFLFLMIASLLASFTIRPPLADIQSIHDVV
ncbi:cytochrome P450 [Auricularia subglabra TFB-10046 SS5]|nr:cytochrome P450 [Auricularia subglabra TFB-10046 SS5]